MRKADAITQTKGGVIVSENPAKSRVTRGTVVAVGPGVTTEKGKHVPCCIKVGDRVLLPDYGGTRVKYDEKNELFLYRETDILAKIQE